MAACIGYRECTCKTWSTVQPKRFKQINFTCVLRSYPRTLANLLCSREILLLKSPFCPSFFLSFSSAIIRQRKLAKIPKKITTILHFTWGCAFWYLDARLLHWLWQQFTHSQISAPFMTLFLFSKLTTMIIVQKYTIAIMTTQSRIASFVLKHLVSYMLAN